MGERRLVRRRADDQKKVARDTELYMGIKGEQQISGREQVGKRGTRFQLSN